MAVATGKTCPNCHAAVPAGRRQCLVCKLEVSKMDAFAAAKKAAQRKGVRATQVEAGGTPLWRRPIVIGGFLVALVSIFVVYKLTGPKPPPPWTHYPPTREDVARQLFTDISVGDDPGYDKAYALVAPSARDPQDSDELGHYRQLYHEVYKYLAGEFGGDWLSTMKIEPDPGNPDTMDVHVGVETLHVNTQLETPQTLLTDLNHHYALTGISEFDISEAAGFQKMEGITGVLRGEAGDAAVRNVQSLLGAMGAQHRETPMQTKLRLLPQLRDPRAANKYEVYQTWPVRKDPVVRRRLEAIVGDQRYDPSLQQTAQQVLNDSVSEEELIAAHVRTD